MLVKGMRNGKGQSQIIEQDNGTIPNRRCTVHVHGNNKWCVAQEVGRDVLCPEASDAMQTCAVTQYLLSVVL